MIKKIPEREAHTIEFLKVRFKYSQVKKVHEAIKRVHKTCGYKAKCTMILGESNTGKTEAVKSYMKTFPDDITEEKTVKTVLYIQLDEKITPKGIITLMLHELGLNRGGSEVERKKALLSLLESAGVSLIIVDEIQHVLPEHGIASTQACADFFKTLLDKSKIPVVFVGLPKSLRLFEVYMPKAPSRKKRNTETVPLTIYREQDQLKHRALNGYMLNPLPYESNTWSPILNEHSKKLGVKGKVLLDAKLKVRLWVATTGYIGRLSNVIEQALEQLDSNDNLTLEHFETAYEIANTWNKSSFNPFSSVTTTAQLNTAKRRLITEFESHV